ncbi:DNA polymerase type B [Solimonas aquatica]|uniref:DNA-directed DNA polymerase n=1 Tax=Solimonas aquatica TaxID=489703 RepID=A0A1H9GJK1_9GAMM|nr:DNA polymerase [Solimonas aquatica]SEQ50271.1 DNA polymerase type B [Solimonas aquatica]
MGAMKRTWDFSLDDIIEVEVECDRELRILDNEIKALDAECGGPLPGLGPSIVVGVDSEWRPDPKDATRNVVLSVQFYLIGECGEASRVVYPTGEKRSQRPGLVDELTLLIGDAIKSKVVLEWPREVVLCGYFTRADLTSFGDIDEFKRKFDGVGGSVATTGRNADFEVAMEAGVAHYKSSVSAVTGMENELSRLLSIRLVDLARHTAPGTSLAQVGEWLQLPKLKIPEGFSIERMHELRDRDPGAFEAYGLRDAEIAAKYYLGLKPTAELLTKRSEVPATVSALAVATLKSALHDAGFDFQELWGLGVAKRAYWDDRKGKVRTQRVALPRQELRYAENLIVDAYHGGRNESFCFGPTPVREWFDYDLRGAYTTALLDLSPIDYARVRRTTDPSDFVGRIMGFAWVTFAFPPGTRFPCLPIRTERGLVFTLVGETACSAPEIALALSMGCEVKVRDGVIFPWIADDDRRFFEPFVSRIARLRRAEVKGSLREAYFKLVGNSLYGKTAQGLREKRAFNTRRMGSDAVPRSAVTHAAFAAHATGFVRAVMGELLAGLGPDRQAISVTTDGFITDAPIEALDTSGAATSRFRELSERVAPGLPMLERKHGARQIISMKTRGQATSIPLEGHPIVLAMTSVSPPVPKPERNDYMVDLFLGRTPDSLTQQSSFASLRDQWVHDFDLVRRTLQVRLNLEYDMKRRPLSPGVQAVRGVEHLAFDTGPWGTREEMEQARAQFDGWRRERCLKTLDDYAHWSGVLQFRRVASRHRRSGSTSINLTREGAVGVARRTFLRLYAQKQVDPERAMPYSAVAAWLTAAGYPTTLVELKNASRASIVEHSAPNTADVHRFLQVVSAQFPDFDVRRIVVDG